MVKRMVLSICVKPCGDGDSFKVQGLRQTMGNSYSPVGSVHFVQEETRNTLKNRIQNLQHGPDGKRQLISRIDDEAAENLRSLSRCENQRRLKSTKYLGTTDPVIGTHGGGRSKRLIHCCRTWL